MQLSDLLSRPDLIEAIGELYVMGFVTEHQIHTLEFVLRIEAMRNGKKHVFRNQVYAQLSLMKDVPMTMESLKNLDYYWRKPISRLHIKHRLQHLQAIATSSGVPMSQYVTILGCGRDL